MQLIIRLAIGFVLLLASATKWLHPLLFIRGVKEYRILPAALAAAFATALIPFESWLAIAHLFGWQLKVAVPAAAAMFTIFGVAVGINLARGNLIPCHCFGGPEQTAISPRTMARLLLLIMGEMTLFFNSGSNQPDRFAFFRLETWKSASLACFWAIMLLIAVMWLLSLGDVADLLWPYSRSEGRPVEE